MNVDSPAGNPTNNRAEERRHERERKEGTDEDRDKKAGDPDVAARTTPGGIGTKTYPAPADFDDADSDNQFGLYARAPWFDTFALDTVGFCGRYATEGYLPCGVPLRALASVAWCSYYRCADGDLVLGHGKTLLDALSAFAKAVLWSLSECFKDPYEVPERFEMDLFWYRTRGEMKLVRNSMDVMEEQLNAWRISDDDEPDVSDDAYVSARPQPRAEFHYVQRSSSKVGRQSNSWSEQVRQERRCRSMLGYAVPYQSLTAYQFRREKRARSFVKLKTGMSRIEVPQGCYVESPAMVSYEGSYLMDDARSGWWRVFYTEMMMKIAAGIIHDVYDTYRLWCSSPRCIRWPQKLDLSTALGTQANADESDRLLDVIESVEWNRVDSRWRKRYVRTPEFCPGRQSGGGDFMYYDPWRRTKIGSHKGNLLASAVRPAVPDDHPKGWYFGSIPDSWDPAPAVNDRDGWRGDVRVLGDDECGEPDDAVGGDVAGPSGSRGAVGPSAVDPAPTSTVPVSLPSGSAAPALVDPDTNPECGCESSASVVRRFLTEVGLRPDEVTGLTYYELRGYLKALWRDASVGGGMTLGRGGCGAVDDALIINHDGD